MNFLSVFKESADEWSARLILACVFGIVCTAILMAETAGPVPPAVGFVPAIIGSAFALGLLGWTPLESPIAQK